jgi:hypothetical protein
MRELKSVLYGDVVKARTTLLQHVKQIVVEPELGMVPGARVVHSSPRTEFRIEVAASSGRAGN